jgi:hypothetical protein
LSVVDGQVVDLWPLARRRAAKSRMAAKMAMIFCAWCST